MSRTAVTGETPFSSTQIQSLMEEVEEEEQQRSRIKQSLQRFVNSSENSSIPSPIERSSSPSVRCISQGPRKRAVTLPKKARKTRSKKLSVTEQMIQKLSGKPSKVRQMKFRGSTSESQGLVTFCEETQKLYDHVFTDQEWRRVKYQFPRVLSQFRGESSHGVLENCGSHSSLWNEANEVPLGIKSDDLTELYENKNNINEDFRSDEGLGCPITLSQVVREAEADVLPPTTVISDSEDDGEPLMPPNNDPIVISSQLSNEDQDHKPFTSRVKFKSGRDIQLNDKHFNETLISIKRAEQNSEEIVINSSDDEDDLSHYIEIKRPQMSHIQIPSTPEYE